MGRILISCAEADRAAGEALRKRLAADGMAAQIVADGSVAREEDLAECRIYILLFSQRANESTQMLQALQKAVASGTVVIPLRLTEEKMADGYHYYLSTIHWLDGTNQRLDGAIEQLCRRCASILSAAESTKPDAGGKKRLIQWLAALLAVAGIVTAFFLLRPNAGTGYPGDTLRFGRYEQDGNASNGPEPIEWIVADEKDGILLLVSAQCLDVMPYNDQDAATTWETCSLRQWLNEDFVDKAFTEAEREQIAIAQVENSKNGSALESAGGIGLFYFDTDAGNDTQDRVYLLSNAELDAYFPKNEYSAVSFTAEAAKDAETDVREWWTRCAGKRQNMAVVVDASRNRSSRPVNASGIGVLPVIRIKRLR